MLFSINNLLSQSMIDSSEYVSLRNDIIVLIEKQGNCSTKCRSGSISPTSDTLDKLSFKQSLNIGISKSLIRLCEKNEKLSIIVLTELIVDEKYDWTCNILLYYLTQVPAHIIFKYCPSMCDRWRIEQKNADIKRWNERQP